MLNVLWIAFPIEPTRSYEALMDTWLREKVTGAIVTHAGEDLGVAEPDEDGLASALLFSAN